MRAIKKIGLMAVGDEGWQGGIQYIINIINGINTVAEPGTEIHLFKNKTQKFNQLDKFNRVTITQHDTDALFEPFSFNNRVKWFVQRKLSNSINPRTEQYFKENSYDYVYPGLYGASVNSGAWIADFQSFHYPDGAEAAFNKNARQYLSAIAQQSTKLVLSSQFCERDCHHFFPLTKSRTHVMPFAVYIDEAVFSFNAFSELRAKYSLPGNFLVVANLFAPTKNHTTLFDALGILKKQGITVNLVCTGNIVDYRNEGFANEILQVITKNKIREQVHLLGLIPRADQVGIFRMATAMVQPSLNEGWSTPVEEAKALGKTLLLSEIEVHKEQYPGNPCFFESLNAEDLAEKIRQVWHDAKEISFPDTKAESLAYSSYQENVKAFGRRFFEIAAF